jgi:hypothetical protein
MEALISMFLAVAVMVGLGIAADRFGVDSRPGPADDHAR